MTSEMVLRVAKALCDEGVSPIIARETALAAIQAMREPTNAMLKAGVVHTIIPDLVWTTMIDEALLHD
jgi:hypothetical protein